MYNLLAHAQLSLAHTRLKDKLKPLMGGPTIQRLIASAMASRDHELVNDITGEDQFAVGQLALSTWGSRCTPLLGEFPQLAVPQFDAVSALN